MNMPFLNVYNIKKFHLFTIVRIFDFLHLFTWVKQKRPGQRQLLTALPVSSLFFFFLMFCFCLKDFFSRYKTIAATSITAASTATTVSPWVWVMHLWLRAYVLLRIWQLFTCVSDRCAVAEQAQCLIAVLRVKGYHFKRHCTKVLFVILWMWFVTMQYSGGELWLMERHCSSSVSATECLCAIWIYLCYLLYCVEIVDFQVSAFAD